MSSPYQTYHALDYDTGDTDKEEEEEEEEEEESEEEDEEEEAGWRNVQSKEDIVTMAGGRVPALLYSKDAVDIVFKLVQGYQTPLKSTDDAPDTALQLVGAPAVLCMLKGMLFPSVVFFVLPWIDMLFIKCPESGFAQIPVWLKVLYLPFIFHSMYLEVRAQRWVLPAVNAMTGGPSLCGFKMTFCVWAVKTIPLMLLGRLSLTTMSLFAAKVVKTRTCSAELENAWYAMMQDSVAPFLGMIPFWLLTCIVWFGMSTQLIWALWWGAPRYVQGCREESCFTEARLDEKGQLPEMKRYVLMSGHCSNYESCGNPDTCLWSLAKAARACSILEQQPQYIEAYPIPLAATNHLYLINKTMGLIFVFVLLEATLYINLQAAELQLNAFVSGDPCNKMTFVSICLSASSSFLDLVTQCAKVKWNFQKLKACSMKQRMELGYQPELQVVICICIALLIMSTLLYALFSAFTQCGFWQLIRSIVS